MTISLNKMEKKPHSSIKIGDCVIPDSNKKVYSSIHNGWKNGLVLSTVRSTDLGYDENLFEHRIISVCEGKQTIFIEFSDNIKLESPKRY